MLLDLCIIITLCFTGDLIIDVGAFVSKMRMYVRYFPMKNAFCRVTLPQEGNQKHPTAKIKAKYTHLHSKTVTIFIVGLCSHSDTE